MRPGQLHLNELELAIFERLAQYEPWLKGAFAALRVLSRKYTGVGCYTEFISGTPDQADERHVGVHLEVPGVPMGMFADLLCRGGSPYYLEIVTYGNDHWDGTFEGFSIPEDDDCSRTAVDSLWSS